MLRILSVLFLSAVSLWAFAAPWAPIDTNAYSHNKPAKSLTKLVDKTLLPLLLARQTPLRYCVEGAPEPDVYARYLEKGYTEWFAKTAQIIRQANRADEFSDILPFLEKPLLFERQPCSVNKKVEKEFYWLLDDALQEQHPVSTPEHIRLLLLDQDSIAGACGSSAGAETVACAASPEVTGVYVVVMPILPEEPKSSWWSDFLHELGHTLGMGEGYKLGDMKNNPFFGTSFREGGIMNARMETPNVFSCDEADAMVAFVDSVSVPGKPARRGKTARTFQSFCAKDPVWYVDGRQQKREARSSGDERRFMHISYKEDGSARKFDVLPSNPRAFSKALRLFENYQLSAPVEAGGMKYYRAADGRQFAVQDLEDSAFKRIFTVKNKKLLGSTVLDTSSPNMVRAVTLLYSDGVETRQVREESIFRKTHDTYGSYFVWVQFEGEVRNRVLYNSSAQTVYVFPDWMVVSLIAPGSVRETTFLLEKSPRGQRMHVYQSDEWDNSSGGSFLIHGSKVQALGKLRERDEVYLKDFIARKEMQEILGKAANINTRQMGRDLVSGEEFSSKDVLSWAWTASQQHAKMASAVKMYLSESPFGLDASRADKNAYREFSSRFRPSPPLGAVNPARKN